jgi:hypothetical protein
MTTKLYEKIKIGDRRTVVKHANKGEEISFEDGSLIILKAHVKLKSTEEFRGGNVGWVGVGLDLASMVEVSEPRDDRPPPTSMPTMPWERDVPKPRSAIEKQERSLFERIFGKR